MAIFALVPLAGHGICAVAPAEEKKAEAEMEFVRVAANRWTFEQVPSGRRLVPFGGNLVFNYPNGEGLDQGLFILAQSKWDPQTLHKAFAAARSLNMNVIKVFLPSHLVLPDPQAGGKVVLAKMEPPLLDRLDEMFQIARENRIYIVLTFSEWGGGGLRWWQDGGTFIGHPGVPLDSFAVLAGFWKQIAGRYKNEPALFSYNLAVEFLMPQANWSAGKGGEPKNASVLNERWGLPAWQAWLKETYGTVAAINKAWGTQHADFCEIPQPDYIFDGRTYSVPQAMLADYNSFREYVSYAFFKNQVDAIRDEDTRHMISCGMHPAQTLGGWQGSAWFHNGLNFAEMDLFDYTTTHLYTNASDNKPGVSPKGIHGSILGPGWPTQGGR